MAVSGRQPGELERIQMHGNRLRGVAYVPTWQSGKAAEPENFTMKPVRNHTLDGDPDVNVHGSVYPIDVDANGTFELLHFNGYRTMRAYGVAGNELWQVDNPSGRVHRSGSHRDTLAIFDVDGDGGQDIVHCWSRPGEAGKLLVARDGASGKVLGQTELTGQKASGECQLAAFRTPQGTKPIILVAGTAPASAGCKSNYEDVFSYTIAFRPDLTKLWERTTCDAGHYVWPLDADGDGRAEQIFVGKYLLTPSGEQRCELPGFGTDHVDSMTVADFDPKLPGLEALTVGNHAGTRLYRAATCTPLWTIPTRGIRNPQQTAAARTGDESPAMLVATKLPDPDGNSPQTTYSVDAGGNLISSDKESVEVFAAPSANANLDGVPSAEDRLTSFGQVVDANGRRRLGVSWYWNLQSLTRAEKELPVRSRWARNPFAFDFDNDGRDELVVWGRRKLIIGTLAARSAGR